MTPPYFISLPKIDMIRIWINSIDANIIVRYETWLTKSVNDDDINMNGYNVACNVKSRFLIKIVLSKSICKYFELLAVDVENLKGLYMTVLGCFILVLTGTGLNR